jgi:hypothetical protein
METEKERQSRQRAVRDKQMDEIEASLTRATDLVEGSRREIQRSRDLMTEQRHEDARQDAAEDKRDS